MGRGLARTGRELGGSAARDTHRVVDAAEDLEVIRDPAVHTVYFRRRVPAAALRCAEGVASGAVTSWELTAPPEGDGGAAAAAAGLPWGSGGEALVDDIDFALRTFRDLVEGRPFHAQLAVVAGDACRRFHVDHHQLRWVVTYAGPGTEWLTDDDVAQCVSNLGASNLGEIGIGSSDVRHAARGDVILMKGKGHDPPAPGRGGPLHRSPPIEARGLRRLVLTLTER